MSELAHTLEKKRKRNRPVTKKHQYINFVREGEHKRSNSFRPSILEEAKEWKLDVDLGKQLKFPEEIVHTSLRPDIVFWSKSPRRVILVELTVPWEERVDEAFELKKAKYEALAEECRDSGWRTTIFW